MNKFELPHLLLDQSKDLIWMVNPTFHLIYANRAYLRLMKEVTGLEKKLNETVLVEGFGEGYIEKWKTYYTRALKGDYFEIEEHYNHPASNEIQYTQVTFEALTGADHKIFAIACQSKDITRLVKQKSEANQLIDASLDVFCTVNESGIFVYVSAASESHWGFLPEELIGKSYHNLILEEDVPKTNEIAAAILNGQEVTSFVNRYKKKDGGMAYNLWSVRWDRSTRLMYAVARDGKEKIEQEEKILQSEQRFKALVQEGHDLTGIIDVVGNYTYMSPKSMSIVGMAPEAFIGRNVLDFIHPEDVEQAEAYLQKISNEKRIVVPPLRFQNHQKEWRWLEFVLTNMLDNPAVKGIVANSRDITEEKKLKELNRQVRNLAKIGSWEVDLVNQTIFWSDEVHLMHETDPKSFVPNLETGINFYREDFRQLVQLSIEKCITTGHPFDFEAVLVTANKRELWVRAIGNTEFENGECKRIYGSFQDINELKEAEIRIQALADNLPGVVFQYLLYSDGTNAYKYVSKGSQQVWGFSPQQVMQNPQLIWAGILSGGGIEEFQKSIADSIISKTKWTTHWKYVMPNGEMKTLLGFGAPVFLSDATVLFNTLVLDVTQEIKNEVLLEQASQLSRIGSWELDLINQNEDSMYWSSMVKDIFEVDDSYKPTLAKAIEFYIGESKNRKQQVTDLLIKEGIEFDEELLLLTSKGHERWCRCIGKSEMANNKRTKIYGSFQDITKTKKAEESLRISEEKNSLIMNAALDAIICIDVKGNVIFWNPQAQKIFGWLPTEIMGCKLSDYIIPENYRSMHDSGMNHYINTGEAKIFNRILELSAINKNGEIFPVELTVIPIKQGDEQFFCAFIRDITERKKAELEVIKAKEKAEENEVKFKAYTEQNSIAIYTTNVEGDCVYANENYLKIAGMKIEEVLGQGWMKALHPDDLKHVTNNWHKSVQSHGKWHYEYRFRNKNGKITWVEGTAKELYSEKKEFVGYLGTNVNITERKQAEEKLLKSNERFQKVTEATNDAIWDWDIVKKTYYRSKGIENFFGKGSAGLFSEHELWARDYFHPDDIDKIKHSFYEAILNPFTIRWEYEFRVINELEQIIYVIDRAVIVRNNEGKAIRIVGAMTDISEQKKLTQQLSELNQSLQQYTLELEHSNEELEQFAFVASHDLQEPLRMISSFMEQLKRKYGNQLDEKAHQYIHFATDGAIRMKQIILDLVNVKK